MAQFKYKAVDLVGRTNRGKMDAINIVDLEMRLKRLNLDLIDGEEIKTNSLLSKVKVDRHELINFCFHLEQLSRSGVAILDGLTDLRDSLDNQQFREVIASIIESIEGGRTLSQSMAEHPRVFDNVFVNLIKAGEDSGTLPEVLKNLTESLKWQDELASHTKKLVMYPAFVFTVVTSVTLFLMIYLVPKMANFIVNIGQNLPIQTKILIATSNFFVDYWYLIISLPIMLVGIAVAAVRTNAKARYLYDSWKLRIPIVGSILRKVILSRFVVVFAMLYRSGISVLESIRSTENVVGNLEIKAGLQRIGELIAEGKSITVAFQTVDLFPPLIIRMLRVGENTGALDTALINVSYFYNRDVRESIEKAQAVIEPAMTLVVGLILGWVMLSVLGPIYDIISKMKF
jgi:type IV pilus assembly protein PilC